MKENSFYFAFHIFFINIKYLHCIRDGDTEEPAVRCSSRNNLKRNKVFIINN